MYRVRRFFSTRSSSIGVLLVTASLLLAEIAPAQQCPGTVVRTIVYRQISNFPTDGSGIRPHGLIMKLSTSGNRVVFVANGTRLYTMDTADGAMRQVVDVDTNLPRRDRLDWIDISADGQKVIWAAGNYQEIFIANFDGSNQLRLATALPKQGGGTEPYNAPPFLDGPRITADGSRVLFFRNGSGSPDHAGLYSADADGSDVNLIFSYRSFAQFLGVNPDNTFNGNISFYNTLAISDDGSRVAFAGYVPLMPGPWVFAYDGSFRTLSMSLSNFDADRISVAGDGSRVAFFEATQGGGRSILSSRSTSTALMRSQSPRLRSARVI